VLEYQAATTTEQASCLEEEQVHSKDGRSVQPFSESTRACTHGAWRCGAWWGPWATHGVAPLFYPNRQRFRLGLAERTEHRVPRLIGADNVSLPWHELIGDLFVQVHAPLVS
jgi:hypothetical protein